jgi:hypothetical protein
MAEGYYSKAAKSKCIPQETEICNVKLATAYVPFEKLCTIFSPLDGLRNGTIFPEIFSPWKKK